MVIGQSSSSAFAKNIFFFFDLVEKSDLEFSCKLDSATFKASTAIAHPDLLMSRVKVNLEIIHDYDNSDNDDDSIEDGMM